MLDNRRFKTEIFIDTHLMPYKSPYGQRVISHIQELIQGQSTEAVNTAELENE